MTGERVALTCHVSTADCGEFHNIKWYKDGERVFVYSERASVQRAERTLKDRASLRVHPSKSYVQLIINPVQPGDEGRYKCDITYLQVKDECTVVQFLNLTTIAKPRYMKVAVEYRNDNATLNKTTLVKDNPVIGPFHEGREITLTCEAGGGKPVPRVTWWNSTKSVVGDYRSSGDSNGVGTGVNTIYFVISRADLGLRLECQAENEALKEPLVFALSMDVYGDRFSPRQVAMHGGERSKVTKKTEDKLKQVNESYSSGKYGGGHKQEHYRPFMKTA
ncbi:unnamed protein product [Cyprideis torosa]|uniref:Uncharacterized protein n=1 Tax=Cyprideis torosa TaxID=163714 RepID=A0A7R8ZVH8_9CRUS|nr:unnamed protein product [Cyprideis torosa]CAG0902763.1 unnamed protein product [Cyprideis torosa]